MDIRHIHYDGAAVTCLRCQVDVVLPRDDENWPPPSRVRHGKAWIEVAPEKRRPDGTMGFVLPPKQDALVDFILTHKHDGEGR